MFVNALCKYYILNFTSLGAYFNKPVDDLPQSLKKLRFGWGHHEGILGFNQKVDKLPPNLQKLIFKGERFNRSVSKLPSNLKKLEFGGNFNRSISKLPPTLTHLTLGENYSRKLDLATTTNLKYLKLQFDVRGGAKKIPTKMLQKNMEILLYTSDQTAENQFTISVIENNLLKIKPTHSNRGPKENETDPEIKEKNSDDDDSVNDDVRDDVKDDRSDDDSDGDEVDDNDNDGSRMYFLIFLFIPRFT